jgi:hypothetical protein
MLFSYLRVFEDVFHRSVVVGAAAAGSRVLVVFCNG